MPIAPTVRSPITQTPEQSNAEVLLWQSSLRFGFALLVAAVGAWLLVSGRLSTVPDSGSIAVGGYLLVNLALAATVRRDRVAHSWKVWLAVAADIVFVFGITYQVVPPEYYDRALLFGFAVLHLTHFYYGRSLAWAALVAIMIGYIAMISAAIYSGAALSWLQELWSLTVFALISSSFVVQYGNFKWRLTRIVSLFERAEEGDFSGEYDVTADTRPDSITLVGRAYNRVRSQLANLVLTDALSGCLNRRGMEQQLSREVSRAVRNGNELTLIALDVDRFKMINDTFGHLAGDAVIHEVGELLRSVARTGDVVARTGGDEFMLLLPDTNAAGAFRLATRIREEVASHRFDGVSGRLPVTVSIGLVSDRVSDENVIQDLHSRADEALYAAKDAGRNRVSIWTPNLRVLAVTRANQQLAGGVPA